MKFAAMAGSFLLSCLFLLPLAPAQAKTKTGGIIIHSAYEKQPHIPFQIVSS